MSRLFDDLLCALPTTARARVIDEEFELAAKAGFQSVESLTQYAAWSDADIERVRSLCRAHGMTVDTVLAQQDWKKRPVSIVDPAHRETFLEDVRKAIVYARKLEIAHISPRPPGLGAPPAIAWDSACDRSLAAASSPAGVAVSPPPASPWIVRWRSPAWPNAPRVCLRARARSLGVHIHLPAPTEIWPFAPVGELFSLAWLKSTAAMQRHFPVFPIGSDAVVPGHLRSPSGIGHIGPIAFVKTRSLL